MLKLLLKNNISGFFDRIIGGKKGRKGIVAVLFVLLMGYAFGVMGWIVYKLFCAFAGPMYSAGLTWLYFAFIYLIAFAATLILSVFAMKNQVYEAKDNDLLLSMPIEPKAILSSRLVSVLLLNSAIGLVVFVPAYAAWAKSFGMGTLHLLPSILLFIAMNLLVIALSALFGWLLSLLTSRLRRKTLFETFFSLLFIAAYFWLYSQAADIVRSVMENGEDVARSLGAVLPVYWVGAAAGEGNIPCLVDALVLFTVPYLIVHRVLSATFIKTATARRGTAKRVYRGGPQKVRSLSSALLRREAKRFFSSSIYTLNAGLGAIFICAAAVVLIFMRERISELLLTVPQAADFAAPALILAAGVMAGLAMPTSASVSIEGKNLWISQSLPVSSVKLVMTKLKFSLVLYIPAVTINAAVVCILFRPGPLTAALSFALALLLTLSMAEIGLVSNLKFPKLEWQTETQAVKQGLSTLVSMLACFALVAVMGFTGYKLLENGADILTVLLCADIFALLLSAVLFLWLRKKGADIYSSL